MRDCKNKWILNTLADNFSALIERRNFKFTNGLATRELPPEEIPSSHNNQPEDFNV